MYIGASQKASRDQEEEADRNQCACLERRFRKLTVRDWISDKYTEHQVND